MKPSRTSRGKLQPEPHPLGDRVRDTVMGGILKQLCDVVQQGGTTPPAKQSTLMERTEFVASKEQYTVLKQGLEEFRVAAGVSETRLFLEDVY